MIDDMDTHVPSPLLRLTCTELCHALLDWQKNKDIHPKASKSKLNADWPDRLNYFHHKSDGGKNASNCAAPGRKLLTSPGLADTYTLVMNPWNTLPESYQHKVCNNNPTTVMHQIQQAENPTPGVVISVEAAGVDNAILFEYLSSEVAPEEPEIGSTEPNIAIVNNSMDDDLHFGMPVGSADYEDDGDECDLWDAILTVSRRRWPATELELFGLGTSDVNRYVGDDGDVADADEEEEASQADDGSTNNVDD